MMGADYAFYALEDQQLLAQCIQRRCLSSGPGGQHVNRTASAISLQHQPTGLLVQAAEHRDGQRNLQEALRRLRLRLALQQRGFSEDQWLQPFRNAARLRVSVNNAQFPLVVARCLDALDDEQGHLSAAAAALACSSSQLVKLLAQHKEVWTAVQAMLAGHGRPPLRHP